MLFVYVCLYVGDEVKKEKRREEIEIQQVIKEKIKEETSCNILHQNYKKRERGNPHF